MNTGNIPFVYSVPTDKLLESKLRPDGARYAAKISEIVAVDYKTAHNDNGPFHIQHGTKIGIIYRIINAGKSGAVLLRTNFAQILQMNSGSYERIIPFALQLNILKINLSNPTAYCLTSWAESLGCLASVVPSLLTEAMHVHLITRWRVNPAMRASWAYAYGISIEKVAFSTNSLAGALHWLGALDPPAFDAGASAKREVRRRQTCPEAAVWWAIGALNASEGWGGAPGTWLALEDAREELLARVLFLDQLAVPAMLDRAAAASESPSGGPCLRFDASRRAVEIVRTLPVGTFPGITDQVNGQ